MNLTDMYIFRKIRKSFSGYEMGEEPLTMGTVGLWMKSIGELAGFEHGTIAYTFRYKAGNNMDRNGRSPSFSPYGLSLTFAK